ncbi:TMhelix containing protein [Vibrio phage 1.111.B._10N.286.45.E6]|nr:TMhelix containing protein [Vibrio phage 1.111.A._10N.286.45.E6]AUR88301.1 TMhelix containing protein [Vibrio phage 1.111.B._10N.286.45.E6]
MGTFSYALHNIYMWNVASDSFKCEVVKFKFFLMSVFAFPVVLSACIYVAVSTEIAVRKWRRENGFS